MGSIPIGTVTNSGNITATDDGIGVFQGAGTVTNNGATIQTTTGDAIYIANDGTVTNSGTINGDEHGIIIGGNGTVNSTGNITGVNGEAVNIQGTGLSTVNVASASSTNTNGIYVNGTVNLTASGTVTGSSTGIDVNGQGASTVTVNNVTSTSGFGTGVYVNGTGTITASGTVTGGSNGIVLQNSGGAATAGTIISTGTVHGGGNGGIEINNGDGTIVANNVSSTGGNAIYIQGNGTVTTNGTVTNTSAFNNGISIGGSGSSTITINQGSTVTAGGEGIYDAGTATVTVAGSVAGTHEQGIVVSNNATLNISGTVTSGSSQGIYVGGGGSATVSGTIHAGGFNGEGLHFNGGDASVTVTQSGIITGASNGVYFGDNATVNNAGSITDTGANTNDSGIHISGSGTSTVNNSGTISGQGFGIYESGSINLANNGSILSTDGTGTALFTAGSALSTSTVSNSGVMSGADYGIYSNTALALVNNGQITGTNDAGVFLVAAGGTIQNNSQIVSNGYGVYAESSATVNNAGLLNGATQGIHIMGAGTVTNSGSIASSGDAIVIDGLGNVTLQGGTVTGAPDAVLLGAGNDTLTINGRSGVTGLIDGGTGTNTIVFRLAGITPAEKASLDAQLAAGHGTITVGGETYNFQDFQNGVDQSISLEQVADPGLRPLASAIDNLTTALPLAFDSFYDAAIYNPEGALNTLSGREISESENNVAFNFTTQLNALITDRAASLATGGGGLNTAGLRIDDGTRLAMASDLESQLGALSMTGTEMVSDSKDTAKQMECAPTALPWDAWVSGTAEFADEDTAGGVPGYHYTTTSPSIGVDYRITPHFALGVLFNYEDSGVDFADGSHLDVDTELAGLYAVWAQDGWRVNALAGYGFNQYSADRNTFDGLTANSSPDGDEITAGGTAAYDFKLGHHLTISPEVGLDYTHLDVDGFSESGANVFDLNVADRDADSLRSHLGARVSSSFDVGCVTLSPQVNAAWYHEFLDNENGVSTSISGAPALGSFLVRSQSPERDFALVGAGLGIVPKCCDNVTIFVNYDAQVGQSDFMAETIDGGVRVNF